MEILSKQELQKMSALALAHIGDAVFELLVRTELCRQGFAVNGNLHKETVAQVCAPAQAKFVDQLMPLLTEEESAVYRRGRNAHVHSIPKNATHAQYGKATGLEALLGMLYLSGQNERIAELFALGQAKEDENAL
ncbi:MAG: ribonuclease III [Ruminococcaceae bacterium]|nr:ribonuclease III [Oscillospiraceae bacterium]